MTRTAFEVAAERQVNDREPLDGTECWETRQLHGRAFVCANPAGHRGASKGMGHRFVHLERDEADQ